MKSNEHENFGPKKKILILKEQTKESERRGTN